MENCAKAKSKASELLDAISGEINGLGSIRHSLEERLSSILTPLEPQLETATAPPPELPILSPVVLELTAIRNAIACEVRRLAEVIERLEI